MSRLQAIRVAILIVVFAVLVAGYFVWERIAAENFLHSLPGEVVYVHSDAGVLDIYTISANGQDKKMIYHNEDKVNANSLFPRWSEDGKTISFVAMKDGTWTDFKMNADGSNVVVTAGAVDLDSVDSRVSDLSVINGSVYYRSTEIYAFHDYDSEFNPGASEVSWGPNKEDAIFQSCHPGCDIVIASKEGNQSVTLTDGEQPDWR